MSGNSVGGDTGNGAGVIGCHTTRSVALLSVTGSAGVAGVASAAGAAGVAGEQVDVAGGGGVGWGRGRP